MKTYVTKPAEVERAWYVVDAEGQTLGRLASSVATILRGKHKPTYNPAVDCGDFVIVLNADKVAVTGRRPEQKKYYRHSLYLGGLKEITLKEHKFVEPKSGRKQLRMSVGYKGALTSTRYTADVTVELDTSVPDKWEVLRIDYTDNNKNIVGWNRKNVEALVKKFNEAR